MMSATRPIRLGLIGAGIFARDAHVPAIKALGDMFDIVAIYSRTEASAAALNTILPHEADLYTDVAALLKREDIEAIDVLLPIPAMTDVIRQVLDSGKHVISEKPITPTVNEGQRLIDTYSTHPELVWMVAENWRYENAFLRAAEIVQRGEIGRPFLAHWAIHNAMRPETSKYYKTAWRRNGEFPGGFLLDAGVHHVATMRLILGEIAAVSATVSQVKPDLLPADTISAALRFENGILATYAATFVTKVPWDHGLTIVGEEGALRVDRPWLEVSKDGGVQREVIECKSIQAELAAFADAIRHGKPHQNSPQEALRDVAVVEAMLQSAEAGKWITPMHI